jgi:hypothetical protein
MIQFIFINLIYPIIIILIFIIKYFLDFLNFLTSNGPFLCNGTDLIIYSIYYLVNYLFHFKLLFILFKIPQNFSSFIHIFYNNLCFYQNLYFLEYFKFYVLLQYQSYYYRLKLF